MANYEFLIEGETFAAKAEKNGYGYRVESGDGVFEILSAGQGLFTVMLDGHKTTVAAASHKGVTYIDIDSVLIELHEPSQDGFGGGAGDAAGEKDKIYAPMPGKIVKIMVKVGDAVDVKQQVVIVEAMKMENPVLARAKGTVKAVNFAVGDQVDTEKVIVELELEEKPEA
jgi:biotin carboxyl carrier protein